MIEYPRSEDFQAAPLTIRVLGVGNAGIHLADRLAMGHGGLEVIALNTDAQSLASSIVSQKIAVGHRVTRGLGTGGDPEVGYEAAQESLAEIRTATEGAQLIFLCAGLGGGTASGIVPLIAEMAREAGAIVFAIVTSPFAFEGRRRTSQAAEALAALATHCQAVIHFENDRMAEISSPRAGIEETFAASDACLSACLNSLLDILRGGSPMPVSLADLLAAIGGGSATALFGRGDAQGDNRAHEALERALKSPLLDRGRLLAESHALIAHISGPPSLSFAEVAAIMRELGKYSAENSQLFLGVTTRPDPATPLTVILLGNYAAGEAVPAPRPAPAMRSSRPAPVAVAVESAEEEIDDTKETPPLFITPTTIAPEESKPAAPRPAPIARESQPAAKPAAPASPKVKQETLQFESVTRGRFEKSEPTIVEGEDLDVPTFLRLRGKSK